MLERLFVGRERPDARVRLLCDAEETFEELSRPLQLERQPPPVAPCVAEEHDKLLGLRLEERVCPEPPRVGLQQRDL